MRDGRSFTTRRCVASRRGGPSSISLPPSTSTSRPRPSGRHAGRVPDPDSLPSDAGDRAALRRDAAARVEDVVQGRARAIELRPCDLSRYDRSKPPLPQQNLWIRAKGRLPDDPAIHRAVLAYASDLTLIDVTLAAHGRSLFEPDFSAASLDHAVWFHRPFRIDDWLLYSQDSPNTSGARGLARGLLFDRQGHLVATVHAGRPRPPPWRNLKDPTHAASPLRSRRGSHRRRAEDPPRCRARGDGRGVRRAGARPLPGRQ